MLCDNCGKEGAYVKKTTKSFGTGDDLIIIENVPVIKCPNCHESYLTAQTAYELEIIRSERSRTVKRPVDVATFEV